MIHKILVVEDDVEDQILFLETIYSIDPDFECHCVNNGAEAIDFLNNTITLPSVILLDLNMPLMNGYVFLEKIKAMRDFANIPVFIFTTSRSPQDKERTKKLGAEGFFSKPNTLLDLRNNLHQVLFTSAS
jgi:CheY-like chemotaxis protein